MKTRITIGFKSKTQMPLFAVVKEYYGPDGDVEYAKIIFQIKGRAMRQFEKKIGIWHGYFLTHYTEYPLYEPAEGGYYYAGNEAGYCYTFHTKWGAKRKLREMEAELEEDGFIVYEDCAYKPSKYIGDGESWHVEKHYGSHNSGRQIYQ